MEIMIGITKSISNNTNNSGIGKVRFAKIDFRSKCIEFICGAKAKHQQIRNSFTHRTESTIRTNACGMISPKITIKNVEKRKPTVPLKIAAVKIAMSELTATFPRRSVQSSKFPCFRRG